MGVSHKREIAVRIAEKTNGEYSLGEIIEVVEAMLESMVDIVSEGQRLCLRGYISMKPVYKKARTINDNLHGGHEITKPGQFVPKIRFGSRFLEACEGLEDDEIH